MIVGIPKESYPGERRVALVPGVLANLAKAGMQLIVEAGAGESAGFPDSDIVDYKWIAPRPHDRRATTNRTKPRLRRIMRNAGWYSGILFARAGRAEIHDGRAFFRSDPRLIYTDGQLNGSRQAPRGSDTAAHHLQRAKLRNLSLLGIAIIIAVMLILDPSRMYLYPLIVVIPLIFGVMMIILIGGADMPTVISLPNSYAG
jgi:hypothetical protein